MTEKHDSEANLSASDFAAAFKEERHLFPNAEDTQYPLPPSFIDGAVYTDQGQYEHEMERIFMRGWFPICPSWDLASPRDYVIWDRIGQSVVVTRLDDGEISAWHNVCQHRGSRLVGESGHCKNGKFKCPWHGFTYDLAGEVTGVPLRESFDEAALKNLKAPSVRAVEWSGFVWITFSDDTPPLAEYLGDLWNELDYYGMDNFETRFRTSIELNANWKVVVDAFNETWHVPFTHQATLSGMMLWRDAKIRVCSPHSWMTVPVQGFTEDRSTSDHHESHLCHYLAFPNTIFSCFPTHLQMWTTWPIGKDKTIVDAWGIVGPTPEGVAPEKWAKQNERDWGHFLNVVSESSQIINQLGTVTRSQGFGKFMFNTAESRLTAFHHEIKQRIE